MKNTEVSGSAPPSALPTSSARTTSSNSGRDRTAWNEGDRRCRDTSTEAPPLDALIRAVQELAAEVKVLRTELREIKGNTPKVEDRLIGISELEKLVAADRVTIWRWYTAGRFPLPVHLGTRRAWRLSQVRAWMDQAGSTGPAAS